MNTVLSIFLMTAVLVLWSPHGAGGQAPSPVLTEHHGQLDVSAKTSIYRNQTSDITIDEASELYRSGQFQQPAGDDASHTNFGLTRDEIWLALEFSTAEAIASSWFLEVGHPSLDEVHLYLFRDNKLILHE
ncbi:MAG: 7TM-DISM domain-containing protein, partial [Marinobacter sp.]|nr:7TM-DISM domain-containing protein [Marinobacter sp.]